MLHHSINKIIEILSTVYGWVAASGIFLINLLCEFVAGREGSLYIVIFCVILDCVWGCIRSHKDGEYTTSELLRESVSKIAVYGSVLLVMIGFDKVVGSEIGVTLNIVSAFIILIEVYSILANALIVYPNFPVLKILKKYLTGEIANKLGVDKKEVDKVLGKQYAKKKSKKS